MRSRAPTSLQVREEEEEEEEEEVEEEEEEEEEAPGSAQVHRVLCARRVGWGSLISRLIFCALIILFFAEKIPEYFGTFHTSLFTMFQVHCEEEEGRRRRENEKEEEERRRRGGG
jgi:Sec-independent protein translocase protein TatA